MDLIIPSAFHQVIENIWFNLPYPNFHPNEYSQEFHYYPFSVKLDTSVGRRNTLKDLSNKLCIPNKTEGLNQSIFNMITGINESKTKHISCKCKCKFDETKCKSNQWWNNNKCWRDCKKQHVKNIISGFLILVAMKMENI